MESLHLKPHCAVSYAKGGDSDGTQTKSDVTLKMDDLYPFLLHVDVKQLLLLKQSDANANQVRGLLIPNIHISPH